MMNRGNVPVYQHNYTHIGFTETREGDIPHLAVIWGDWMVTAPVKVELRARGDQLLPMPCKSLNRRYLHALPDGSTIEGNQA